MPSPAQLQTTIPLHQIYSNQDDVGADVGGEIARSVPLSGLGAFALVRVLVG